MDAYVGAARADHCRARRAPARRVRDRPAQQPRTPRRARTGRRTIGAALGGRGPGRTAPSPHASARDTGHHLAARRGVDVRAVRVRRGRGDRWAARVRVAPLGSADTNRTPMGALIGYAKFSELCKLFPSWMFPPTRKWRNWQTRRTKVGRMRGRDNRISRGAVLLTTLAVAAIAGCRDRPTAPLVREAISPRRLSFDVGDPQNVTVPVTDPTNDSGSATMSTRYSSWTYATIAFSGMITQQQNFGVTRFGAIRAGWIGGELRRPAAHRLR